VTAKFLLADAIVAAMTSACSKQPDSPATASLLPANTSEDQAGDGLMPVAGRGPGQNSNGASCWPSSLP
jgi:hypothetical protein